MSKSPKAFGPLVLVAAILVVGGSYFGLRIADCGLFGANATPHPRIERFSIRNPQSEIRNQDGRTAPTAVLFTFAAPTNAADLDAALPAPAREIHYVRIDRSLITGKPSPFWQKPGAGRVELPLPQGGSLVVAIDGSEMLGPDRFTSTGRIEGRPASRALFAWHGGFLHASVEDPVLGSFALRAATAELAQFYRVDPSLVPPCREERRPPPQAALRRQALESPVGSEPAPPPAAAATPRVEIHAMMVHTQAVLPTIPGAQRAAALQSAFDLATAKVNATFEASLITARLRLVKVLETRYDETRSEIGRVQDDALTALYRDDDALMDEIHAARDAAGADVVCLALNRFGESSGLAFVLTPGEAANADFAFAVVQYGNIAGTNVVPHEMGHLLGCAHDRQNARISPGRSFAGAYSYSYGYRFVGADGRQYHDIMSYPPGTELSYFSNPDIMLPSPISVSLGVPAGLPGESNNALTIERNALATAVYRVQTIAPPSGLLVNVSTRAWVTTGEQVLIGGFIVEGAQPKRLLIRAAGPALRAFGVGDALADPVLRVFSAGNLAAENDDWALPVGPGRAAATEISAAAGATGAFAFPAGSADSALLATLAPGAYTAVVEGARNTTGSALIDVYEVERDGSRIVNLAARGFADRAGREMVSGFVVDAAPGATRRILVRVLGPSLARAPFNMRDALDDPEMVIRDAAGDLVAINDDWSSGAEGGASAENDFRPTVETFNERQIFATGHAPRNRREPCVMLELPAGSYTITVRPFELRTSNPLTDQPAQPGVGVVEVYEIQR